MPLRRPSYCIYDNTKFGFWTWSDALALCSSTRNRARPTWPYDDTMTPRAAESAYLSWAVTSAPCPTRRNRAQSTWPDIDASCDRVRPSLSCRASAVLLHEQPGEVHMAVERRQAQPSLPAVPSVNQGQSDEAARCSRGWCKLVLDHTPMQAVMPGRDSVVSLCYTHTTDITRAVTRETRCKLMLYSHDRYRPRSHARDRMQAYVASAKVQKKYKGLTRSTLPA